MKSSSIVLLSVLVFAAMPVLAATYYVDGAGGADTNGGTLWTAALKSVTNALAKASSNDQIWVAAGTYSPGAGTANSFNMKSYVSVYGGFTNGGSMADRNWTNNPTVLDGATVNYHVVQCQSATNVVLDGFVITRGNAAGAGTYDRYGGGMFINASPFFTLNNCTFATNNANNGSQGIGGGLSVIGGSTNGLVSNCVFLANTAFGNGGNWCGGGVYINVYAVFRKCVFRLNSGGYGGGIFSGGASPLFTNCDFIANSAAHYGGAVVGGNGGYPAFINCTFITNTSPTYHGGGLGFYTTTGIVVNCSFSGNKAGQNGGP